MAFNLPTYRLNVNFTSSTQSTLMGRGITFSDATNGVVSRYYWDFGDGSFSTASNPNKTYLNQGTFSVSLMAANSFGGAFVVKNNFVSISGVEPILTAYTQSSVFAVGVRKLKSSYTGNCFVIRRSNDDATQSVAFNSNGDLDESAITSFVGGNSAYITHWFDQSGSGNHLYQGTKANQPRIVNAGTIDKKGGKVAPYFEGSYLWGPTASLSSSNIKFLYSLVVPELASDFGAIITTRYFDTNGFWLGRLNGNSQRLQTWFKNANDTNNAINLTTSSQNYITWKFQTGTNNTYRWVNGSQDRNTTYNDVSGTSTYNFSVGGGGDNTDGLYLWKGNIQELVVWNFDYDATTDKDGIEANIKNYYNL